MNPLARGLAVALLALLAGCATVVREESQPVPADEAGAELAADGSQARPVRLQRRAEDLSDQDDPHTVLRQAYFVRAAPQGYESRGIASWYGRKFHGRPTSSGEIYDMYELTAAHRTLPLPSFAEVRNLDNGRSIIVRVNDRGPAHGDRVIDVSWAAAVQLGIEHSGIGAVEVRAISFDDPVTEAVGPAHLPVMLQVGSFADPELAETLAQELEQAGVTPVLTERTQTDDGAIWRVRVGPVLELRRARQLVDQVMSLGFGRPHYVYP